MLWPLGQGKRPTTGAQPREPTVQFLQLGLRPVIKQTQWPISIFFLSLKCCRFRAPLRYSSIKTES